MTSPHKHSDPLIDCLLLQDVGGWDDDRERLGLALLLKGNGLSPLDGVKQIGLELLIFVSAVIFSLDVNITIWLCDISFWQILELLDIFLQ